VAWVWFHRFGSPPHFYRLATRLAPWFGWPAAALCLAGLIGGLGLAPPDYQQGDGFRIIYPGLHIVQCFRHLLCRRGHGK